MLISKYGKYYLQFLYKVVISVCLFVCPIMKSLENVLFIFSFSVDHRNYRCLFCRKFDPFLFVFLSLNTKSKQ